MSQEKRHTKKIWYKLWNHTDYISNDEIEWAEQFFTKDKENYDLKFITTDQFLDYLNNTPKAKDDIQSRNGNFDFVELIDY